MNRKSLLLAIAIAASAGSSFAESYSEYNTPFVSTAARADVAAQAVQPRQGTVNPWSISYNPLAQFRSTKSRAEVVAEYLAARDIVNALHGEDSGSSYMARGATGVAPAQLAGQPAAAH